MHDNDIITIKVSSFTIAPGARYRRDGDGSAQEFFEDYFKPVADDPANKENKICIDFDNTFGYASSFISELAKEIKVTHGEDFIKSRLLLRSNDDLMLIERFNAELEKDYEDQ